MLQNEDQNLTEMFYLTSPVSLMILYLATAVVTPLD